MRLAADGEALADGIAAVKVGLGVGSVDYCNRKSAGGQNVRYRSRRDFGADRYGGRTPGALAEQRMVGERRLLDPGNGAELDLKTA